MAKPLRLLLLLIVLTTGVVVFRQLRNDAQPPAARPPQGAATATGTAGNRLRPPLDVPRSSSLPGAWQQQAIFVKPGHWTSLRLEAESAQGEFRGVAETELLPEPGVDETLAVWGRLESRRPLVLAKREPRVIEQSLYTPNCYDPPLAPQPPASARPALRGSPTTDRENPLRSAQVRVALRRGTYPEYETRLPAATLRHHQSLLVVLAAQPDAYRFWSGLPLVKAPYEAGTLVPELQAHYRTIIADDPLRAPLPASLQGWTTTSVVVWDRYDPARLSEAQRQAFLDWLHWGGRLIVSGPESLDLAAESFLGPYLPAVGGATLQLDAAALAPLDAWTIAGANAARAPAWRGVRLEAKPDTESLVAGGEGSPPLVVERRTGRGHVVVTAFRLTEPGLIDWPSYDAFIHGCLLGRPARAWREEGERNRPTLARWADGTDWFEPRRTSDVRFAARDSASIPAALRVRSDVSATLIGPGIAAWRDDAELTQAAREILVAETGLTIPSARFVLTMIGAYVVLLVPVNWYLFSRLGRAELAWLAAPVITLVFSAYVIRSTDLDVGFARSLSEIKLIEMQPEYARAHVARWGSIYNSLSHDYRFTADDPSLVVLPLVESSGAPSDVRADKRFIRDEVAEAASAPRLVLGGLNVASNTMARYRAEQMVDVGGPIRYTRLDERSCRVENGTRWTLTDLRLAGDFSKFIASAPVLKPGESVVLSNVAGQPVQRRPETSRDRFRRLACRGGGDGVVFTSPRKWIGESIQVSAWIEDDGLSVPVDPLPSQVHCSTLLVVHLRHGDYLREHDRNLPPASTVADH